MVAHLKQNLIKYKKYILAILLTLFFSALFVPANFKGKSPIQSDDTQYKGAASELHKYGSTGDSTILWTNALFSGMPSYAIAKPNDGAVIKYLRLPATPRIWSQLFLYILCGFIMLLSFNVRPWLALVGAIGIGFATENLTILMVGHNTKAAAIGYLPIVIAGCQYLFRNKKLLGFTLLTVGMSLEIYVNHVQITYYGGFLIAIFFIFKLFQHIKEKKIKEYALVSSLSLLGVVIALGANSLNLMLLQEYAKDTMRGDPTVTMSLPGKEDAMNKGTGLTKDYTFSYSNGWPDLGATIIPNYAGGDSDKLGLYYGGIGSTSGPKYIGATIFALMIISLFVLVGAEKWWLLVVLLLTIVLSMGGNHFIGINEFMYNHFPLYNKFRAPSMMMVLVQISAGLLAILGIEKLLSSKEDPATLKRLKYGAATAVGIIALLTYSGTLLNDFSSTPKYDEKTGQMVYDSDTRYAQTIIQRQGQQPTTSAIENIKNQLVERRIDEMKKDGNRSLFFAIAVLLALFFAYKGKLKTPYAIATIGLLITIDMWTVGKRYLNDKDFKKQKVVSQPFTPYSADLAIQQDKSYYRVLDLTESPTNSNRCSYFHKAIGGYSAAKLRRYQDLWDWHLTEQLRKGDILDNGILNMLNMKYFIYPNQQQQGGAPQYGQNSNALGNAWFVQNIEVLENADSAILALGNLNPRTTAFVEKEHTQILRSTRSLDSNATITLNNYHPEKLTYSYSSATEANVVFSEVYYDKGWKAYIDGQEVPYARVNYILRGLSVPAGRHDIVFEFKPDTYALGTSLSLGFGAIVYILIGAALFVWLKKEFLSKDEVAKA